MLTQGVHAESSSAQSFHPEFGYFCPTPRLRRKFRSAVITVVAGMVIAAGAALALSPQLAPPSAAAPKLAMLQVEPAGPPAAMPLAAAPLNATPLPPADRPVGPAQETRPAPTVLAVPATRQLAAARAPVSCEDLSGSFLATRCQAGKAGKAGKSRMAQTARARAAAISTGGADTAPQSITAPAAEPAVTANEAAVAQPTERPVPAKKPVKTVHKQTPGREVATADAASPAPTSGFSLFSLFHEPTRTGAGAWAMSR